MKIKILASIIIMVLWCGCCLINDTPAAYNGVGDVSASDSGVVIAEAGKYKDLDYTFLRTFNYGYEVADKAMIIYDSVKELKNSTDERLIEGRYIRTKGYHSVGDKGGACYLISDTKSSFGSIELSNGLYANIINDTYTFAGIKWAVISVIQYGAYGNGIYSDQNAINDAIQAANNAVGKNGVTRAIIYIPEGEYKVTDQLHIKASKINIVGEGDKSIIFTDNDYRKTADYYEFFIMVQEAKDIFLSGFKIEAREVDIYKYMRQVILSDCHNIYIHKLTMIVPQEAWSGFYYEDKQYTNLTLYSGNKNITVDGCYMEQMSGTYRGANLGILDFWQRGEENITVMNCEFHDNARDEQIGIFSLSGSKTSYIKNVDFINNKMYSYKPPYVDLYGNRQMCFTVAYHDSPNVADIHIAGNHFISETDSKFMTFGNVKECVVEDNVFEIYSSYGITGMVFDSSNADANNIIVKNNEFYLTARDDNNQGKAAISIGNITIKDNRIVTDSLLYSISDKGGMYSGNRIIGITYIGNFGLPTLFNDNEIVAYGGLGSCMNINGYNSSDKNITCNNNVITNYLYKNEGNSDPFNALNSVKDCTLSGFEFVDNTYKCPNFRFLESSRNNPYNHILYFKQNSGNIAKVVVRNNNLEGAKGVFTWGNVTSTSITDEGNIYNKFTYDGSDRIKEDVKIKYNNDVVTEITVYSDSVKLSAITTKEVDWITSVQAIATVESGLVKRQQYGTVYVYAVPKDGMSIPAKCCIHFEKQKSTSIELETTSITMQPGYVYDVVYKVLPYEYASQKLVWISSNPSVATVDKYGVIKALAVGRVSITCTTADGRLSKNINVNVENVTVKKINLNYEWKYFDNPSGMFTLTASSYTPNNAVNKSVGKWESTNTKVATVNSNGVVTVKSGGVATIRAYTTDYKYYGECVIVVKPESVKKLSAMDVGKDNVTLTWETIENVYGYNVYRYNDSTGKWDKIKTTTDNTYRDAGLSAGKSYKYCVKAYIARYDAGGRTEYTAEDSNIVTATTYSFQPVNGINILNDKVSTSVGDSISIQAKLYPYNCTIKELIWSVKDTSIATVEYKSGNSTLDVIIRGVSEGVTELVAKSNDGVGYSVTVPIVILSTDRPKPVELEPKYKDMKVKWEPISSESEIDGYVVYRTSSVEYTPVKYISKSALKSDTNSSGNKCYVYIDENLERNVNYGYKIAPYVTHKDNQYSGSLSYERKAKLLPSTINGQQATSTEDAVTISWNSVSGADGYILRLYQKGKEKYVKEVNVTGTKTTITGLQASTTYEYVICAYLQDGKEIYEGEKSYENIITTKKTTVPEESTGAEKNTSSGKEEILESETTSGKKDEHESTTTSEDEVTDDKIYGDETTSINIQTDSERETTYLDDETTTDEDMVSDENTSEKEACSAENEERTSIEDGLENSTNEESTITEGGTKEENSEDKEDKNYNGWIWIMVLISAFSIGIFVFAKKKK